METKKYKKTNFGFRYSENPEEYMKLYNSTYSKTEERKKKVREARMKNYYKNKELKEMNKINLKV